jgi:hypothetical protein
MNLTFYDLKRDTIRDWNIRKMPLSQFILSCAVPYRDPPVPVLLIPPDVYSIVSLVHSKTQREVQKSAELFDTVDRFCRNCFTFSVREWTSDSEDLEHKCQISRNDWSIVMIANLNGTLFCWSFPDLDVYSDERLIGFISKALRGTFYQNYFQKFKNFPTGIGEGHVSFQEAVPNDRNTVVLVLNDNSISNNETLGIFRDLSREYGGDPAMHWFFFNPRSFWSPHYCPTTDGFPAFVFWRPFDRRGHVFKRVMSRDAVEDWAMSMKRGDQMLKWINSLRDN